MVKTITKAEYIARFANFRALPENAYPGGEEAYKNANLFTRYGYNVELTNKFDKHLKNSGIVVEG